MLSHCRIKHCKKSSSNLLQDIYDVIRVTANEISAGCPMPFFRSEDVQGDEEEEEMEDDAEDNDVGATYFDSFLNEAYQLLLDGRLRKPMFYDHGDSGFVEAYFEDGAVFTTDIANIFFVEGQLQAPSLPDVKPPTKTSFKNKQKGGG